ncbi:MAG: NGG1p interacting factor NIF3 [Candidatus Thorarchaeota archaeon]|nr:NGG1p interacting factor NIF3 [Candidatus Thorarchaeota archaeon]
MGVGERFKLETCKRRVMKLGEIYRKIVAMGIKADPRGRNRVNQILEDSAKSLDKLEGRKKEFADRDVMWNPYTDCRLLYGNDDREVKSLLCGIDIGTGEIVLADRLTQKGEQVDLVLAHHPHGIGISNLDYVMKIQPEQWAAAGVPIAQAESAMAERMKEVHHLTKARNHTQTIDAARLLDIPFMCAHTPADSLGYQFLTNYLKEKNPSILGDLVDTLLEIPEYQQAEKVGAGPEILIGKDSGSVGAKHVFFTGGTSAGPKSIPKLASAGISTIVTMHMPPEVKKVCEEEGLYVVIAGHDSSDSIGMNLILDELEKEGIKSYACSGFTRHRRS